MSQDMKKPRGRTGASPKSDQLAGGSSHTVAQGRDGDQHAARPVKARPAVTEQGRLLLVVDCPYCGKFHLHAGGHVEEVITGVRRARCIGVDTKERHYDIQAVTGT